MKNIYSVISPFTLAMLAMLLLWPHTGRAQNGSGPQTSVTIVTTADIVGDIRMETISDMGILDARRLQEGDEIYINPVFDAEAGVMRATGLPNAQIRVSYDSEMSVTRREGPGTIVFRYEISGFEHDNQRESELLQTTDRELRLNEIGQFYFWIGGRVNLTNAVPGNYDGEFTIEIEYI